jgi:hypothetical protein
MSERDAFEQRLETAVREYVASAPTQVDAARLTDSLAANVPRVRRLVRVPALRLPTLGVAWILVVGALLALMGIGLIASGALEDLHLLPAPPVPSQPLQTPPAVIASPAASTPSPADRPSPSWSAAPTSSPTPIATTRPPEGVTITSLMSIAAAGPNTGTFDVRGDAAASGLLCPRGTVTDLVVVDGEGIQRGSVKEWTVPKRFDCADGSGTLTIEITAHVDPSLQSEVFTWRVLDGTGPYLHLQGAGNGSTESRAAGQVVNTYTGWLVR